MSKMVRKAIIDKFVEARLIKEGSEKFFVGNSEVSVDLVDLVVDFMKNNALLQLVSDVREFNEKGGHHVAMSPQIMSENLKTLKKSLIKEETEELFLACDEDNLELERDSFVDSIYVLVGYTLARGFAGQVSKDWLEVQNSNMSKFCKTEEEARDTVAKYKRQLTNCMYKPCDDGEGFVVTKIEDGDQNGKILKSHLYRNANFKTDVASL